MKMKMMRWLVLIVALLPSLQLVQTQQSYVDNKQLDCYNHYNTTDGYVCNGGGGTSSSCLSYLTFRSIPPYNSPTSIAYLLGSQPTQIAAANNVTDVDPIPTGTQILVPVTCSCSSTYFQHNASYLLKTSSETYLLVANNTYQGLTTCQSLMAQNSYGDKNLTVGLSLQIPLRCACPTANQTSSGIKFLVTYMLTWGDDPSALAQRFAVDLSALLAANRLSPDHIIYPFTPILVPLTSQPSPSLLQQPSSPSAPPPAGPAQPGKSSINNNSNKWIFVGVGVGAACLLLVVALVLFLRQRRKRDDIGGSGGGGHYSSSSSPNRANPKLQDYSSAGKSAADYSNSLSSAISSIGLGHAVESLTVYKLEQVQRATDLFSEANRIEGSSVFRASFEGDDAAIKVIKGNVSLSGDEINLLKRINHSNIIRLSGFCVHQEHSTTYLIYEYASSGSLAHRLHTHSIKSTTKSTSRTTMSLLGKNQALSWQQRVQIAHDVADALNYLHNFTHPPYIHKNLKTSNILLDANLRAKISNFGLARAIHLEDNNQEAQALQVQLTEHVVGTHGYMAPEYIQNGVITPKLDVFAFGVVLLELLSGREAAAATAADNDGLLLSASISRVLEGERVRDKFEGFMDPSLDHDYPLELAFSMAQLAKSCVAPQINSRPSMAEALITLSKILSSTLDWDPSIRC